MERDASKPQFKKIVLSVMILALLIFMADLDPAFRKKAPTFSTRGEALVRREEPGLLKRTFCRGNQRPGFCENSR